MPRNSARPFDIAWARSTVEQCKAAGVACFVKQLGANIRGEFGQAGWSGALKSRKGNNMYEWAEDLRVRQFPEAR